MAKTTSIVDYLNSQGKDSSFSARQKLATEYGISNYKGTASQNTQLLKLVQSGTKTTNSTNNSNKSTTASTGSTTSNASKLKGVDNDTYNRMNSQFKVSDAYTQAMQQTNALLEQLQSGRTSYTDQIKSLMDQITNRDKFEYDLESDTLFQQSLASAMGSGKQAMQDTIGQASALTGGYGSTYATSAGNQQYNAFIEDAYNNLPEYYQMALEAYDREGQEMYNQLAMYSDADAKEYQKMFDSWNASYTSATDQYNREYQQWADDVNNAMQLANMQNTDWWNQTNYDESVRQFNEQMALQQKQYEESVRQFNEQMAYNKSKSSGSGGSSSKSSGTKLKEASETQMKRAKEAYEKDGVKGLNDYLNSLPSNIDKSRAAEYAVEAATLPSKAPETPIYSPMLNALNSYYDDKYGLK